MKVKLVLKFMGIPFNLEREIPDDIGKLSQQQFLAVFQYLSGLIRELDLIGHFFRLPLCIAWLISVRQYWRYKMITALGKFTDFTQAVDHFIITHIPDTSLYCLANRFKGITFMQFMFADTMYTQYLQSQNPEHLYSFIAALYMKPSEFFKEIDIQKRVEYLKSRNIPIYIQNAIVVNYMMQKKWLSFVYRNMFSSTETNGSNSHQKQQNWVTIFDAFVGEHIPDTEYYKNMDCMDAFRIINKRLKDYERHGK